MEALPFLPAAPPDLEQLRDTTPARLGVWRCGARPLTGTWLKFRQDHALARDAVKGEFSAVFLDYAAKQGFPIVKSSAVDKSDFILFPPKGKRTDDATIARLVEICPLKRDVQIVISDGLSSRAIETNVRDTLQMILHGLSVEGFSVGQPVVVRYGRVAIADQISYALGAKVAINLIGERPGLSSAESMSAYITLNPGPSTISSDRTVVSNIHTRGTLPVEAGAFIVQMVRRIIDRQVSGVRLQQLG